MGATQAEAERVIALGYERWIDEQLARPASLQLPHVQSISRRPRTFRICTVTASTFGFATR